MTKNYYIIKNKFSKQECINMINKYEDKLEFNILENGEYYRYDFFDRTMSNYIYNKIKDDIYKIDKNICIMSDKFYLTKYLDNSGHIKKHIDGSKTYGKYKTKYTLILYLNDNFNNGHTIIKDTKIKPKCGDILLLKQDVLHKGEKPINGEKYILRGDLMINDIQNQYYYDNKNIKNINL